MKKDKRVHLKPMTLGHASIILSALLEAKDKIPARFSKGYFGNVVDELISEINAEIVRVEKNYQKEIKKGVGYTRT